MGKYNEIKDCHLSLATGKDSGAGRGLLDWLNTKGVFELAELIPCDQLLGWSFTPNAYLTNKGGARTTSKVADRHSMGRQEGVWRSKHSFQSLQFLWWLMQTPALPTDEGNPEAGFNKHTLTIGPSNVPLWHGIHFERESIAANQLRYDMMGLLPSDLVISCGETENYQAIQEITIPYAYVNRAAVDIAAQTPRPTGTLGSQWKDWGHLISGNGAGLVPSGLTFVGAQLEVDIINMALHFHRNYAFGPRDTTANPINGNLLGWDYFIVLDVVPTGDLLYTVNNTKKEDYGGDLDFAFSFPASATHDNASFTYDKMYLVPFDEVNDWNQWFEGYTITLEPLDTNSSVSAVGIDNLDNTHYENP